MQAEAARPMFPVEQGELVVVPAEQKLVVMTDMRLKPEQMVTVVEAAMAAIAIMHQNR